MPTKLEELNGAMFTVGLLLQADERLRDNDTLLCRAFHAVEKKEINTSEWGWQSKLRLYVDKLQFGKRITPYESITRARRLVQYDHGLYLGHKARARLKTAVEVTKDINNLK